MLQFTVRAVALGVGALLAFGLLSTTGAQQPPSDGVTWAAGLASPRGLQALPGGDVLVASVGGGEVLRVRADGTSTALLTSLPIGEEPGVTESRQVGVSAAVSDGFGGYRFVVSGSPDDGFAALYSVGFDGRVEMIADIGAYEAAENADGKTDSNGDPVISSDPYDLVIDESGDIFVSDSAANAVFAVNGEQVVRTFAVFPQIPNPLYPGIGPEMLDQVPMGLTIGPDRALYVATFTSFPYPVEGARIYRFRDINADGDAQDEGEFSVFASGLSTATDVAFDSEGSLFVSQQSTNLRANTLGRVSQIVDGQPKTVAHLLDGPTSLAITEDGRVLVSEESSGRVLDVTDVPAGGFSEQLSEGVNLVAYGGGSPAQLSIEAFDADATSVMVTSGGEAIVLVPGAPTFVNARFHALYPSTVPAGTLLLLVVGG